MRSAGLFLASALAITLASPVPAARAQGYKLDDPAKIAALPHLSRYRAFLPAKQDLAADLPPPGDQGEQSSCVAWSIGYALRSYYEHKRNKSPFSAQTVFSPAYIYNRLTETPNDCREGLRMTDALDLVQSEGIASLADFPYDRRSCSRKPSQAVTEQARGHVIADYRLVQLRADDVKGQIATGNPVAVGLHIDPRSLTHLRAGQIYDLNTRSSHDGHAVAIVGYDDTRQAFKFINSWGPNWAEHGFGWISYTAFEQDAHVAAVIQDAEGPIPPPAPGPEPGPTPAPNPSPPVADWEQGLKNLAQNFQCAWIALSSEAGNRSLIGWVGRQEDLAALEKYLSGLAPRVQIASEVALRPWPQCEALLTLKDVVQDHGLKLAVLDHQGTEYESGNQLKLQITTPDMPSYLYVTYVEASGEAVQLYKPRGIVPQALPPRTVVTLGGGDDPRVFRIGPPFGHEMIVAVASASPLFTDGIAPSATEREYLTALRKTLEYKPDPSQPDRVVDGDAIALTTHEAGQPAPTSH